MDWEAHRFLCISPDAVLTRHVHAVAGFSITGDDIGVSQRPWTRRPGTATSACCRPATSSGPSTSDIWVADRRIGPASPQA